MKPNLSDPRCDSMPKSSRRPFEGLVQIWNDTFFSLTQNNDIVPGEPAQNNPQQNHGRSLFRLEDGDRRCTVLALDQDEAIAVAGFSGSARIERLEMLDMPQYSAAAHAELRACPHSGLFSVEMKGRTYAMAVKGARAAWRGPTRAFGPVLTASDIAEHEKALLGSGPCDAEQPKPASPKAGSGASRPRTL